MKNARKSPWRLLYKFHRYVGLGVGMIAIMLALTGIALNHTEDLQLDSRFVKAELVLDWYGIAIEGNTSAVKLGEQWLSQSEDQVYFNEQLLFKSEQPLQGAIATDVFIVVAHPTLLTLLSLEGELIEQIKPERPVLAIGVNDAGAVIIKTNEQVYASEDALLSWQVDSSHGARWSAFTRLPKALEARLQQSVRQQVLPYERVMLDLHSGRLFGKAGVWVVDLSAIMLILLAVSGTWIWLRPKLKRRSRRSNSQQAKP